MESEKRGALPRKRVQRRRGAYERPFKRQSIAVATRSTLLIPSVYADRRGGSSYCHINALPNPSIAHKSERKGGCGCDDVGMREIRVITSSPSRPRSRLHGAADPLCGLKRKRGRDDDDGETDWSHRHCSRGSVQQDTRERPPPLPAARDLRAAESEPRMNQPGTIFHLHRH